MANNVTRSLYAVESWYSWHSRDDYTNMLLSRTDMTLSQTGR